MQAGVILTIGFSISNLLVLIQILVYVFKVKKFYRQLDEGYFFVEDSTLWTRRKLYMVHPNNVDLSSGTPIIINPACIRR